MSISSVSAAAASAAQALLARAPTESTETREHDGDPDDGGATVAPAKPSSTVNLSGQVIGQIINTQA